MSKTIASTRRTKTIGDRRTLTATAALHSIGEQEPYFSVTAEERNLRCSGDNQVECCGCMHDEILQHFPDLAPVVKVHLSDEHGVPMHAISNALYWMGFSTWGGKATRPMAPDDDYGRRTLETAADGLVWAPEVAAGHLRVTDAEVREIRNLLAAPANAVDRADVLGLVIQSDLAARWQADADAARALLTEAPADEPTTFTCHAPEASG